MVKFKLCAKCERKKNSKPNKKKYSSSYGRTKGLAFERYVANKFKKIFPEARRQLEFQKQDANGVDLQGTGDFKIQCKAFSGYAPISCLNEVKLCPIDGGIPVLITKGTNLEPVAVLRLDYFLDLVKDAMSYRLNEERYRRTLGLPPMKTYEEFLNGD